MKTTLFLSTFAAGLVAVATTTFAQNFVNYPQAAANAAAAQSNAASIDRFARSDLAYQGSVTPPQNKTTHSRRPVAGVTAPQH